MESTEQRNRLLLIILGIAGVVAATQVVSIATTVVPNQASTAVLWTFFISLWVCTSIVCALAIHLGKRLTLQRHVLRRPFTISLRQGTLLAGVLVISRFFTFIHILSAWDIIPLIAAAILIEFFFQAEKKPIARISHESLRS